MGDLQCGLCSQEIMIPARLYERIFAEPAPCFPVVCMAEETYYRKIENVLRREQWRRDQENSAKINAA